MISSHEPTAPEVDALRAELAEVKAERDEWRDKYAEREQRWHWNLIREGSAIGAQQRAESALTDERAAHARTSLLKAALVGDITDLRDLMARRATPAGDDYTIPALVTADGVAAALTTILNQEQS